MLTTSIPERVRCADSNSLNPFNRHQNSPYTDVLSIGAEVEFQKNLFRFLISNSSFNDDISSILTGEKDKLYIGVNYREF